MVSEIDSYYGLRNRRSDIDAYRGLKKKIIPWSQKHASQRNKRQRTPMQPAPMFILVQKSEKLGYVAVGGRGCALAVGFKPASAASAPGLNRRRRRRRNNTDEPPHLETQAASKEQMLELQFPTRVAVGECRMELSPERRELTLVVRR